MYWAAARPPATLSAPDVGENEIGVRRAVDRRNGDTRFNCHLDRRHEGVNRHRGDENSVDATGDEGLDIRSLLGGIVLSVGKEQLNPEGCRGGVRLVFHRNEKGKLEARNGHPNGNHSIVGRLFLATTGKGATPGSRERQSATQ
jgi:hypothetical protein